MEDYTPPKIYLNGFEFTQQQMSQVVSIRKLPIHRLWRWIEAKTGIAFAEQKYEVVIGNLMIRINQTEHERLQEARAADQKVREVFGFCKTLGFKG